MGPALRIGIMALGATAVGAPVANAADDFASSIRPVLAQNCWACHNPANPKNRIDFLKANTAADMELNRALWRDVAAQMRNRTMPPVETKLTEDDRLRVANWIDNRLRETACYVGDYAGAVALRRLNRREFHNTIRDLLGVEFNVSELFPADGTGGAGFDTNGETLFIPPLMMERYLEAAQQILDRAIVTPPLRKTWTATDNVLTSVYVDSEYDILVTVPSSEATPSEAKPSEAKPSEARPKMTLSVDGGSPVTMAARAARGRGGRGPQAPTYAVQVHLARGLRNLVVASEGTPISTFSIQQKATEPAPERLALHYRLLGTEPGNEPLRARVAAEQILRTFLRKAWRRPVENSDVAPLLTLYDRAAGRGDPFEERMKLALKAVLVGPDFLFKMEHRSEKPGIWPLGQYELASRLAYFLWSTMPDEELTALAAQEKLQEPAVLRAQVDRMLDDPKSHAFTSTFIGQWLGTQDVGGRAAPMLTELQAYYTPPVAADLRAEPILLFERILGENRSLLELLTADYTYMTDNLVKFYQLEDKFKDFHSDKPTLVKWPDNRRAGMINSGAVMAMTSHYRQTSPVLRGAWVLETILGTPVPPPPPNVPALEPVKCLDNCVVTARTAVGMRGRILAHRVNPACSACHNLMDPIGFAMENFDWTGRWREKEFDDSPIDASGTLPSGEKFDGPVELRNVLLGKKDEFLRHLTGKVLGYALGRSLQDGDSCTVQHLADALQKDNYQARTLIREIVLSTPFRNSQGGKVTMTTAAPPPPKMQRPMVVK
jgi:cytochrome c553